MIFILVNLHFPIFLVEMVRLGPMKYSQIRFILAQFFILCLSKRRQQTWMEILKLIPILVTFISDVDQEKITNRMHAALNGIVKWCEK